MFTLQVPGSDHIGISSNDIDLSPSLLFQRGVRIGRREGSEIVVEMIARCRSGAAAAIPVSKIVLMRSLT